VVEVILSDFAIEDLQEIYDFIAKDSPHYAEKQINKFLERIEILNTYPLSGKIVPEYGLENRRELVEGDYRIVYEIFSEHNITILSFHHGAKLMK
jgi:toxin ParE1/3/4